MRRCICGLGALAIAASAPAAVLFFDGTLLASNEVPAVPSPATGTVTMSYDDVTNTILTIDVFVQDLTSPIQASHIHVGAAGTNGGVIVNLGAAYVPDGGGLRLVLNNLAFPAAHVGALMAGNTYVNVHTQNFGGGEVRGQLILIPAPGGAALGALALAGVMRRRR